jgi:hypothetical protein
MLLVLAGSLAGRGAAGGQTVCLARSVGTGRDTPLYSVSGIALDERSNMFVTDRLDYSVKKFDGNGACRGRVGRRGTGPGEFRSPALSLVTGGRLVVLQASDPRIELFDTDLKYRGEFVVRGGMPVDIAKAGPRGLALALYSDTAGASVLLCEEPEGINVRRIVISATGMKNPLYAASHIAVCRDGSIVVASLFLNRVEMYSTGGKLLRRFSIAGMVSPPQCDDDGRVPGSTYFRKVVVDGQGRILLLGGNQAFHPGRDLFVCSSNGSYLRTCTLQFKPRVIVPGGGKALYATDETGTRIERYIIP